MSAKKYMNQQKKSHPKFISSWWWNKEGNIMKMKKEINSKKTNGGMGVIFRKLCN